MKGSETMSTSMTKGNPLKLMLQFALSPFNRKFIATDV